MSREPDPYAVTDDGVPPVADGAADGVLGRVVPDIVLEATDGGLRSVRAVLGPRAVVYVYPATGVPGRDPVPGWDAIPGAVGCTVQNLGFRDQIGELRALGYNVVGLSAQASAEQCEFVGRVGLSQTLLSDPALTLKDGLALPTFMVGDRIFYRRLAMIVEQGRVTWVDYPIFPPQHSAARVLAHLRAR